MSEPKENDMRVCHIPSHRSYPFNTPVASVKEGQDVMRLLNDYDIYLGQLGGGDRQRVEIYEDGGWSELSECDSKGYIHPIKASEKEVAPERKYKRRYYCYKVIVTPGSILDDRGEFIVVASSFAEAEKVVVAQCNKNPQLVESIECLGVAVIPESLCESDVGVPTDG